MSTKTAAPVLPDGLFFDKICKHFGGTRALHDVTMNVGRGEIVALLGENGAGKSTLIKILGGIYQADSGAVVIDKKPYKHTPGSARVRHAVAFIHQDLGLIEWMSITENMSLAQGFQRKAGLIDWKACEIRTAQALQRVGCDLSPSTRVSRLSRAEKSLVAIARALAVECDFLVLDEPTASLPADDVKTLFSVLKRLRNDGVGMIYVSHRLDEVFDISDRVVVLRDGETVGVRSVAHTSPEELVDLIVGRKPKAFNKLSPVGTAPLLSIKNLHTPNTGPITLEVHIGEILGLVGLRGAGQEDIGRCLFGTIAFDGEVTLNGAPFKPSSPQQAMQRGIGLIPRDRVVESVATSMSIRENLFLNPGALGRGLFSFMSRRGETKKALVAGIDVGLKPNAPELPIDALSGGNQQKVIIGRWLTNNNQLLIAEDPTAGVDVGAKAEIYSLLNEMVTSGVPVVVISTDFEEVATLCNRAIIFNRGLCIKQLQGHQLSTEALVHYASASDYQAHA